MENATLSKIHNYWEEMSSFEYNEETYKSYAQSLFDEYMSNDIKAECTKEESDNAKSTVSTYVYAPKVKNNRICSLMKGYTRNII